MDAICKMSKSRTTWPCSAKGCPFFGDCIVEYQRKVAIRQKVDKAIEDFRYRTGHSPAAILAEPAAFIELLDDHEAAYRDSTGEYRWGIYGTPLRKISPVSSGDREIYLIDKLYPILTLPKEEPKC